LRSIDFGSAAAGHGVLLFVLAVVNQALIHVWRQDDGMRTP
jgi:hypothetical protein